jgi:Flp pilus assembly protein TadD
MKIDVRRCLAVAASLIWLTGCKTTSTNIADIFKPAATATADASGNADADTTGSIAPSDQTGSTEASAKALLGADLNDDLSMAKRFFRDGNYGLAERYFRRAAEAGPRDAEAWLGLAASYDRLKRYDLADRAYGQVVRLTGHTPEVLNNIGYSYMLRGDYSRAGEKLR